MACWCSEQVVIAFIVIAAVGFGAETAVDVPEVQHLSNDDLRVDIGITKHGVNFTNSSSVALDESHLPSLAVLNNRKRVGDMRLGIALAEERETMNLCLRNSNQRLMRGLYRALNHYKQNEEQMFANRPARVKELAQLAITMVGKVIGVAQAAGVFEGFETSHSHEELEAAAQAQALDLDPKIVMHLAGVN